jgi:hypothetical protein
MASRAIITGASGTVGSRLSGFLRQQGFEVIPWDRSRVPVDDYAAMERFVRESAPEVLFHLATASQPTGRPGESWLINYEWTSELAWITRTLGIRFVFSSTALVFSNDARGPFTKDSPPDAAEGYGYEKRRAEERVFHQNPEARVVRLGWQIGEEPTGNNMVAFLEDKMRQEALVPGLLAAGRHGARPARARERRAGALHARLERAVDLLRDRLRAERPPRWPVAGRALGGLRVRSADEGRAHPAPLSEGAAARAALRFTASRRRDRGPRAPRALPGRRRCGGSP